MSRRSCSIILLAAGCALLLSPNLLYPTHLRDSSWRQIYHSLQQPLLGDSAYVVGDTLRMQLPDFSVTLMQGQIVPLHDSAGVLTGWLFEGNARVRFSPRHELERRQLHRFTQDSILFCNTSTILWRFVRAPAGVWATNSSEPIELAYQHASPEQNQHAIRSWMKLPRAATKISTYAAALPRLLQKELLQRRGFNLAAYLLSSKHANASSDFVACAFYADESRQLFSPLYFYLYEPEAHESIQFLQFLEKGLGRPFYTVCSYPRDDYFAIPANDSVQLTKYNGWVELRADGQLTADMGVDIFTARQKLPVLFFQLATDLTVAHVTSEFGDTLDFVQEKKEYGATVFMPDHVAGQDTIRLLFHYDGKMLQKNDHGVLFLKDMVFWVPRLDYLRRAVYKIIFKYPRSMRVLAVGKLVREWEEGEHRMSFYTESFPAKAASFSLGRFDSDTLHVDGLPRLEIHSTQHRSNHQRRHVATDVANSLFFFENLLAPYMAPALRVVEAPGYTSHGFPGFVTLSWVGFQARVEGVIEALRSHEVAHQWFGNAIGWATYHDQWLSEAFAEYLGALYVEWVLQDRLHFAHLIKAWREDLLEGGSIAVTLGLQRFGLGKDALKKSEGMAAGPLYMGIRLGQKEALDYYLQTYIKGAYVLHTLRWLLRDLETGGDAKFWQLLSDFGQTHWGADPSTRDFQKIAEKHYGASLDWFFNQWIYDTAVPTYRWQSEVTVTDSGNVVKLFVQQEEVPRDFRMPVPVAVEYDDGVRVIRRVWVDRHGGQLRFPPRAAGVKRVVFNEGEAVLCRVRGR
jgi:hypothetical protein